MLLQRIMKCLHLLLRDILGMIDSKILEFLSFSSENFYNCLVSKKILL